MSVTFDAITTSSAHLSGSALTTLDNTSLTVGSGSNRALIALVTFSNQGVGSIAVNWDATGTPQALSLIKDLNSNATNGRALLFGLIGPTPGNKTLRLTYTNPGTSDSHLNAVSFTGVDQTGSTTTFYNAVGNATAVSSSAPTITVTSATGDAAVDCVCYGLNASAPTQTQIVIDNIGSLTGEAASRAAGAASVVFGWTLSGNDFWVEVATAIKAASASSGIYRQQSETGDGAFLLPPFSFLPFAAFMRFLRRRERIMQRICRK